ncbi:hypothetical protein CHARACLAT_018612 [Characodon lateralis]|uniref:Uncharacterized protein n=1 Tax=Characodon lateralis TaxID=208331 RepID=A0ABU7CZF3_9TELE|nr:hypothetical protein [Characodon lateralis]
MSYNQSHRELSSEQLTSAEETLTDFKDVVVKFEEEFDGQPILLDFTRIPLIILHRIDLVQHCVKEEVNFDQQPCNQEEPEPLQIKEEHDELEHLQIKEEKELYINKDEEQHVLKQETDTFVVSFNPSLKSRQGVCLTDQNRELVQQERSSIAKGSASHSTSRDSRNHQ